MAIPHPPARRPRRRPQRQTRPSTAVTPPAPPNTSSLNKSTTHPRTQDWIAAAESQLEATRIPIRGEHPRPATSRTQRTSQAFDRDKQHRRQALDDVRESSLRCPTRRMGRRHRGARTDQLGYDPDSEKPAVGAVVDELERLGFTVDDRQTAGSATTYTPATPRPGQRLVEVKD